MSFSSGQQQGQGIYCEMKTPESSSVQNHHIISIIVLVDLNLPVFSSDTGNFAAKVYFGIMAIHVAQTQVVSLAGVFEKLYLM